MMNSYVTYGGLLTILSILFISGVSGFMMCDLKYKWKNRKSNITE